MQNIASHQQPRIAGIDTLRLGAAIWALLESGARPPLERIFTNDGPLSRTILAINDAIFGGNAAGMLFLLLSGYVLHRRYRDRTTVDFPSYLARRLTRVAPPALAAWIICAMLGGPFVERIAGVAWIFWSVLAFQLVYPALLPLLRRHGVRRALLLSLTPAAITITLAWRGPEFSALPLGAILMIFPPVFLLGCSIAETGGKGRVIGLLPIAHWRVLILIAAIVAGACAGADPSAGVKAAACLAFALIARVWIGEEFANFKSKPAPNWSETGGAMAWSLCLAGPPIIALFAQSQTADTPLRGVLGHGSIAWFASWLLMIATIALAAWAFHALCEAPSRRLSRQLSRRALAPEPV